MQPGSVFAKTLWESRRGIVGWAVGIAIIGVVYAAFYPLVQGPEYMQALEAWPEELRQAIGFTDVATAAGYLGASTFGLLSPALVIIYGGLLGSRAIAGDEEAGRLDLLLAHPIGRIRVLLERFAALGIAMALASAVQFAALVAVSGPAQLDSIGPVNLAAASIHLAVFGTFFGALALGVGAATGRRSTALGVLAVVAVGGYIANALAPLVSGLDWVTGLSPFHYYSSARPLVNGLALGDLGVLLVVAGAVLVVGAAIFDRRDVAV